MIHSLAGGIVSETEFFDFAKVETENAQIMWFISNLPDLGVGDKVIVPVGRGEVEMVAKVLRVDKHVNGQTSPLPLKKMKKIIGKI